MNLTKISQLPEWDDHHFRTGDEEGEEWKPNPTREACKALYAQWQQVMILLSDAIDSMKIETGEDGDGFMAEYWKDHSRMILGDGFQVAVKIKGSEAGLYTIRMENAAVIRAGAQFIRSSMLTLMAEEMIPDEKGQQVLEEIDKFRELFKCWVSTFQRDEYEDAWGLFT